MNEKVNAWLEAHQAELLKDIADFCAIPSVKGEAAPGMPFGKGPCDSLQFGADLCARYGFSVKNYDNYVAAADLDPALPRSLDILAHTDVVPAGEGWTVTEPFKVVEKDGRLYGRGTSDDKGPLLCSLYAMRAIKECGVPLKKGVRLIMGADEECGSEDIAYYYQQEPEAEMTFSPDGEFPLINIEKGQFKGTLAKHFTENKAVPRLLSLEAGVALNAVPQKAVLRFEGLALEREDVQKAIAEIEALCEVKCETAGEDQIIVWGTSAHASTPEAGKNAGLAAVLLTLKLPLQDSESEMLQQLRKLPALFPYGVTDGSGLGIKMEDAESHDLTCTLDMYHIAPDYMEFSFDARTPVMATKENCEDVAKATAEAAGFDFSTPGMIPPHRVAGDSDFVKTLLKAYEDVTGLQGECLAIGGGTYVHHIENGVAFGAVLPGIDTRMHGADEFFDIDNIMLAAKVYAEAILALCE